MRFASRRVAVILPEPVGTRALHPRVDILGIGRDLLLQLADLTRQIGRGRISGAVGRDRQHRGKRDQPAAHTSFHGRRRAAIGPATGIVV